MISEVFSNLNNSMRTKLYPPLAGCARNSGTAWGYKPLPVSPGRGSIVPRPGTRTPPGADSSRGGCSKLLVRLLSPAPCTSNETLPANPCLYCFSGFPTAAHGRYTTPRSRQSRGWPRWGASLLTAATTHHVCNSRFAPLQGLLL